MHIRRVALLIGVLSGLGLPATALTLTPDGLASIQGHAAGTFDTLADPAGFAGGLAWGPDGTAYTLDGARVLYRWNVQTGRSISRTVLTPPASLPDAGADFGPRLLLDGFRADGGALSGPYVRVEGYRGDQAYRTGFTLRADGRAVLGEVCAHSPARPGGCQAGYSASVRTVREGRATLTLEGRQGPADSITLPAGTVLDVKPSPDGTRVAALRSVDGGKFSVSAPLFLDIATRDGRVLSRQVFSASGVQLQEKSQVRWVDAGQVLTAVPIKTSLDSPTGQGVALWGLGGQRPRWEVGGGELRDAVPSPDGQLFLTVRGGSVPEVRRLSDGSFVRALGTAVTASVPMPGNRALLALDTGNGQGELRIVERGGRQTRLGGIGLEGVTALALSPDGAFVAAAYQNRVIVLDRAGRTLHTLALPGASYRQELRFAGPRTLWAQVDNGGDIPRRLIWDAVTGQTVGGSLDLQPLPGGLNLQTETRRLPGGEFQGRLSGLDGRGQVLWQEPWRGQYSPLLLPSPDGRALVRHVGRLLPGDTEPRGSSLYRLDPRTGQASPGVTLCPLITEVYRGLSLLDFAPDRRHVLLGEGSGDGCGGAFYGLRLADLSARREVGLPAALTTGLTRFTGCGQPVPLPTASFTPENGLLVRDGNSLNWWRTTP